MAASAIDAVDDCLESAARRFVLSADRTGNAVCVQKLRAIFDNILREPATKKFRKLKIGSPTLIELFSFDGVDEILRFSGFRPSPNFPDKTIDLPAGELTKVTKMILYRSFPATLFP